MQSYNEVQQKPFVCMYVFVTQSFPTLCDPMDYIAFQAPLSLEFSRKEYWSGLPFPSPGDLPNPGIRPRSCALQADSLLSEPPAQQAEEHVVLKVFDYASWNLSR